MFFLNMPNIQHVLYTRHTCIILSKQNGIFKQYPVGVTSVIKRQGIDKNISGNGHRSEDGVIVFYDDIFLY